MKRGNSFRVYPRKGRNTCAEKCACRRAFSLSKTGPAVFVRVPDGCRRGKTGAERCPFPHMSLAVESFNGTYIRQCETLNENRHLNEFRQQLYKVCAFLNVCPKEESQIHLRCIFMPLLRRYLWRKKKRLGQHHKTHALSFRVRDVAKCSSGKCVRWRCLFSRFNIIWRVELCTCIHGISNVPK